MPELLVAPLVGVRIEEARAVHLARRANPVEREGQRRPAGLRTQLFLAHVVRPAAATLADAAAHHQHVDDAAIVHVAVVPVVHRGADDHHRLAVRLVRVVGELACHRDQLCAWRAGDALLPRRRVGRVVVEISSRRTRPPGRERRRSCATCRSNTVATSASRCSPALPSVIRRTGTVRTSTSVCTLFGKCSLTIPPK